MAITVLVPTPLQKLTQGKPSVDCEGVSIKELLDSLEQSCPGVKARLCDETGAIRRFVNFYVNGEDIRFLQNLDTPITDGDEVSIVPAIAGG